MRHSIAAAALAIIGAALVGTTLPATAAPISPDAAIRSAAPDQPTTVRYHHRHRYGYAYHRGCAENEGHRRWTPCDR
jgi:hypothetical protein